MSWPLAAIFFLPDLRLGAGLLHVLFNLGSTIPAPVQAGRFRGHGRVHGALPENGSHSRIHFVVPIRRSSFLAIGFCSSFLQGLTR